MKIELYKADKLSQKGSSLRSMIMNKDMPVLDLLVRESLQNSLDAKDDSNSAKFVNVEFIVDNFDRKALDKELEGVSLASKPLWNNRFLAIKDTNTVGLTGRYDDKKSNLYKLVYGIMEAQQASGAGGSWGIGKTVYFRIGVGLVFYYSRVRVGDKYESLIAADLVEDETTDNSILPAVEGQKYGIAWWGNKIKGKDGVQECRDKSTINAVLDAFKITPFTGNQTGTVIIIPFINENALLANNQPTVEEGESVPFWRTSIKEYLKISVQKWYAARLANKKYPLGKYLNVSINGKGISPSEMEPFFKLTQALYNKAALTLAQSSDADNIRFEDAEILCEEVRVNKQIDPAIAGCIAFTKVNRKQLGMTVPTNAPSPYEYINSTSDDEIFGKPLVMFCRKPGMVVSYETDSKWTSAIPKTGDDEFIVGYFVLNSKPSILNISPDMTLEDYARKSELADHTSWDDCDLGGLKPTILSKIKRSVARRISTAYEVKEEDKGGTESTGLGSLLGRILLPPDGFGRRPSSGGGPGGEQPPIEHKNIRYTYSVKEYTSSGMVLSVHASSGKKKAASFGAEIRMDSMTGPISSSVWEGEMGLTLPFFFNSIRMDQNKIDGEKKGLTFTIEKTGATLFNGISSGNLISKNGDWYGISFKFEDGEEHSLDITLTIDITVRRKDIKPVMSFEF